MKYMSYFVAVITLAAAVSSTAQVASHAPVTSPLRTSTKNASDNSAAQISTMAAKPVARVNGAVLTEIDLKREMYMMFPYAQQHGGMPKGMEGQIRQGAMDMMVFEELLYQDAKRRNVQVPAVKLAKAMKTFQAQFVSQAAYKDYLKLEFNGSADKLREKIRRSLLIEQMLKTQVNQWAAVTPAAAKLYYEKNPKQFEHSESFSIQTISIIPPQSATKQMLDEAHAKIKDAMRLGKAAKTSRDFGLIAEQVSEDDWRTKLGDRGEMEAGQLPPPIFAAARKMKPGEVSDVIKLGTAYVVFRLNAHKPAGKTPFPEISKKLQSDLQKQRIVERRAELHKQLRKDAKIEIL